MSNINVLVFQDTIEKFDKSDTLKKMTEASIKGQQVIKETEQVTYEANKYPAPCKIYVTKNGTMHAAAEYSGKKVAVLNFASATTPGGGVEKGASAQEECLCRVSNLFLCLSDKAVWEPFYQEHRNEKNNIHNDDIIYTPDVRVIKDDSYADYSEVDQFNVDVITCAAPNLRENLNNPFNVDTDAPTTIKPEELFRVHYKRATKIMQVAASKGAEVLILGAFGCGVFRNDPAIVARAYKEALQNFRHAFKEVEFAIFCARDWTNYDVFCNVFNGTPIPVKPFRIS